LESIVFLLLSIIVVLSFVPLGEDPFEKREQEKRDRVSKQKKNELQNRAAAEKKELKVHIIGLVDKVWVADIDIH